MQERFATKGAPGLRGNAPLPVRVRRAIGRGGAARYEFLGTLAASFPNISSATFCVSP